MTTIDATTHRCKLITVAALLCLLTGFSYPIIHLPVLAYLVRNKELPVSRVGKFRMVGGGFLEAGGIKALVIGILTLGVVSVLDVLTDMALWRNQKRGAKLGLALLPLYLVLGTGFMMPYIWIIGPLRAGLVIKAWNTMQSQAE